MSQAATEGQAPQGAAGAATGQEPGNGEGTGQEPPPAAGTSTDGQIDVEAIADPALKAFVIAQQKAASDARAEAAKHRTEKQALEAEHAKANETAEQTAAREAEEAKAERERLVTENRTLKVGAAVRSAAEAAKAHDPDTVLTLIESRITLNAEGQPDNVPELLADLRKDKPFLFKRTSANAGEGQGDDGEPGGGDMNAAIRRSTGRA